nr:hypothetical protein [Tanacetum cinerariifolium]
MNDNDFALSHSENDFPPPWSDDGASISGNEGDLETRIGDEEEEEDNDVNWQHDPYHLVNKAKEIKDLFDELDQSIKDVMVEEVVEEDVDLVEVEHVVDSVDDEDVDLAEEIVEGMVKNQARAIKRRKVMAEKKKRRW